MRDLISYWRGGFGWRKAAAAINAYEHYEVTVADVPVHFMRKPGRGPIPIPLILTHGRPWTTQLLQRRPRLGLCPQPSLPDEQPARARTIELDHRWAPHLAVHMFDGATLAHGLSDSPAGLPAWLLERWNSWSDNGGDVESVFTKDDLLTHATIYWATNSIATSMRYHANANRYPWTPAHDHTPVVQAPVGLTFVTYENPPGVGTAGERVRAFKTGPLAGWFNHINVNAHERGGHFVPWENPEAWGSNLRRTFHGHRP
ncbi:epoxide hydrolase N-terminal domain-containing protein [Lentzea albidocapillata]|uniref:epoxide hydrolase N-terminal domain-containing protein n=1 Tax=Lentzea albidocapillata TaxID=40571 RepID=UPI0023EA6A8B|nr:epoxide hydrolase N-terminal domain-containing protein [Lentzea albidocapillata]